MHPINSIRTEEVYREALRRIETLMDAEAGTPKSEELDALADLVVAYERKHYPIDPPDPLEVVKFYMEQVTPSCGNVYEDLGFPDAEEMLVKAKLALGIKRILKAKEFTQIEAAERMGIPPSKLSAILKGHFHDISEASV